MCCVHLPSVTVDLIDCKRNPIATTEKNKIQDSETSNVFLTSNSNWFVVIGWELLLSAVSTSGSRSVRQLALRVIVGAGRGDVEMLVYRISWFLRDTTLSMHTGGRVSWRMIAFDLFW